MPDPARGTSAMVPPALLRVAHVRRVHGLRGEVRAQSLGGDVRRFRAGTTLLSERDRRPLVVRTARPLDGDEMLLAFDGVTTREDAAALSGQYVCVEPVAARALGADEWFVWQLVGLRAQADGGEALGVVTDVEAHPAGDVLVVNHEGAEQRYPMVRAWVSEVDVDAGLVTLTPWPELD